MLIFKFIAISLSVYSIYLIIGKLRLVQCTIIGADKEIPVVIISLP